MPDKKSIKERLKEITDSIEKGIAEVFTSGKYADYLRTMSRFHRYSVNNRILIYFQDPNASRVAGYRAWQDKFGRHVVKGAKGIQILAPTPIKKKIEEEKLDPDTKLPMLDENGNVITEEKEIKIPMFKPVTVFDVSQTDGKPLPTLAETLVGNVQNYDVFMEALRRSTPMPIIIEPMESGTDGYFSLAEQNIHLREGMSEIQTVCAAIHEMAHSRLHNTDMEKKSHTVEEIEAESVAYTVCAYYGIETDANSFGYLASYVQDKSVAELKNSLDTIGKTADELISNIDRNYAEIMKERGLDVTEQIATEAAIEPPIEEVSTPKQSTERLPDPAISIEARNAYGYTDPDMLPLTKERALELFERDVPVYMLYDDNTEAMAFEEADITLHTGIFGVSQEDWEKVKDDIPMTDTAVHTAPANDIVAPKREDVVSYVGADSIGTAATDKDNPLRNAEMMIEDDYGMIDGIINNGKQAKVQEKISNEPSNLQKSKKPSVLAKLDELKKKDTLSATIKKNTERDLT